ncbi:cyclin-B1-5-like [Musa acuminata AAA Group]|uniref:cyclin-B1-5-like n=1 Tax=Musa acuminata AAA Group TaxID=214697 RepID=UPI0031CF2DBA
MPRHVVPPSKLLSGSIMPPILAADGDLSVLYAQEEGRPCEYMDFQVDINEKKRSIVADRLIEVHHNYGLLPETLYLTFQILDRYLSKERVLGTELLLVGVSALLIASEYEEPTPRKVYISCLLSQVLLLPFPLMMSRETCILIVPCVQNEDCGEVSYHVYTKEQILAKEKAIVKALRWNLSVRTQYVFLVRFVRAAMSDKEVPSLVHVTSLCLRYRRSIFVLTSSEQPSGEHGLLLC